MIEPFVRFTLGTVVFRPVVITDSGTAVVLVIEERMTTVRLIGLVLIGLVRAKARGLSRVDEHFRCEPFHPFRHLAAVISV